jgi:predicted ATPase
MRELVANVMARSALSQETVDTVVERTSGVPLFAEETDARRARER